MKFWEFENILKEKMSSSKAEVDTDKLLLDLGLAPDKKRKYLLLWLLGISILVIGYMAWKSNFGTQCTVQNQNSSTVDYYQEPTTKSSQSEIKTVDSSDSKDISSDQENHTKDASTTNIRAEKNTLVSSREYPKAVENSKNEIEEIQDQLYAAIEFSVSNSNEKSEIEISTELRELDKLNYLNQLKTNLLESERSIKNPRISDQIVCPKFNNKNPWSFDLIPEVGLQYSFKSLTNLSTSDSESFLKRKENEKSLEGIQAALYGRLNHANGLYVKAGLSYLRMAEKMEFDTFYTKIDTTIGIVSITESQDHDTLTIIYGEIYEEYEISKNLRKHYYIHQYDFPISLGYSKRFGANYFEVEGGININLSTRYSGYIYSDSETFIPAEGADLFKKNVGIGYFLSAYYRRQISNHGSLYVGPRYTKRSGKFNDDNNVIQQNYSSLGIHFGYIHSF